MFRKNKKNRVRIPQKSLKVNLIKIQLNFYNK